MPFHPWCVCCTSLALHYCYWHDLPHGSLREEAGGWRVVPAVPWDSSPCFVCPCPSCASCQQLCLVLIVIVLSSYPRRRVFLSSSSYRHPCHVFGLVVIFGSSCHHRDGLSCSLSYPIVIFPSLCALTCHLSWFLIVLLLLLLQHVLFLLIHPLSFPILGFNLVVLLS